MSASSQGPTFESLQKILTIEQLPAMPHSALVILKLDSDLAKVDINDLVRPIEADPGLLAQVLKFLNSSYFGFQSAISNVRQGIALVGIRVVKNFVLWKVVFNLIPKGKIGDFNVTFLWQDSFRRAMFARFLLMELRKGDPEIAFAGSLLQDMAIPLLLKKCGDPYVALLGQLGSDDSVRLSTLEQQNFGWTHADAARVIGKNWKLPDQLSGLLGNHLHVEECLSRQPDNWEQLAVSLSALLPSVVKETWTEREMFEQYYSMITSSKPAPLEHYFSKVDKEFDQYATIIQVTRPKKQLMEYL
ncbi:MAG: HDOD domain-containing protein [Thermoguttaceae bacterium]